jgi:hypothetical protein
MSTDLPDLGPGIDPSRALDTTPLSIESVARLRVAALPEERRRGCVWYLSALRQQVKSGRAADTDSHPANDRKRHGRLIDGTAGDGGSPARVPPSRTELISLIGSARPRRDQPAPSRWGRSQHY